MLPTYFRIISKFPMMTFKVLLSLSGPSPPFQTLLTSYSCTSVYPGQLVIPWMLHPLIPARWSLFEVASILIGELLLILQNPTQMSLIMICLSHREMFLQHSILVIPSWWHGTYHTRSSLSPPTRLGAMQHRHQSLPTSLYIQYLACSSHSVFGKWMKNLLNE